MESKAIEFKVYDIIYRYNNGDEIGSLYFKRVTATRAYINDHGQLILEDNGRQIEAFTYNVWIKFVEVKPNENS